MVEQVPQDARDRLGVRHDDGVGVRSVRGPALQQVLALRVA
ncbi:Uncharacterised protein [Mycobacteroides abscessus]|nr:Uncharacterised protein [Mycobacteroides abscessus]